MRRMRRRNVGCAAEGTMPRSGFFVDGRRAGHGERGDHGKVFGLFCCQRSSSKPVPGQVGSVSKCAGAGHSFLLSLHCSGYEKNMRTVGLKDLSIGLILAGWGCSWRVARKARTSQTFRGSGCRGGLGGRLRRTSMGLASRFPNFLSFPPDSVLHPGFWNLLRFHSLPTKRVPVFQVSPVIKSIGHVKRKFHEVIGPARRWVQAHLDVRMTSGKRWLRFLNGKRILRDMLSDKFRE